MTGLELAYLVGALVAVLGVLFLIRRAAAAQLRGRPETRQLEEPRPARAEPRPRDRTRPARDDRRPARRPEPEPEAEAEGVEEAPAAAEAAQEQLRAGLAKTRGGFVARLGRVFARKRIDDEVLGELEEVLFTADIGPRTAARMFDGLKSKLSREQLGDADAVWTELRRQSRSILAVDAPPVDPTSARPFVILVLGVNGVGKTTTIGKLAAQFVGQGKKVILGAGDTFRAAAAEQLEIWGQRAGAPVVRGKEGGDPSSVIFDAIRRGVDEDCDIVIADTAGRLHTKVDLMEELKKVGRVANKAAPGAPHETWLVVDATTGQNAIAQAQLFKEAMAITGIVLTKLDGTAKGGVILGICDELKVPVRYIGIGEKIDDLREFDPEAFVAALYEPSEAADAA